MFLLVCLFFSIHSILLIYNNVCNILYILFFFILLVNYNRIIISYNFEKVTIKNSSGFSYKILLYQVFICATCAKKLKNLDILFQNVYALKLIILKKESSILPYFLYNDIISLKKKKNYSYYDLV